MIPGYTPRSDNDALEHPPCRFDDDSNGLESKTDWLENVGEKRVLLGPKAQEVLKPWLNRRRNEFLFQPFVLMDYSCADQAGANCVAPF